MKLLLIRTAVLAGVLDGVRAVSSGWHVMQLTARACAALPRQPPTPSRTTTTPSTCQRSVAGEYCHAMLSMHEGNRFCLKHTARV